MILIADSGSTKTDWCIVFNDTVVLLRQYASKSRHFP